MVVDRALSGSPARNERHARFARRTAGLEHGSARIEPDRRLHGFGRASLSAGPLARWKAGGRSRVSFRGLSRPYPSGRTLACGQGGAHPSGAYARQSKKRPHDFAAMDAPQSSGRDGYLRCTSPLIGLRYRAWRGCPATWVLRCKSGAIRQTPKPLRRRCRVFRRSSVRRGPYPDERRRRRSVGQSEGCGVPPGPIGRRKVFLADAGPPPQARKSLHAPAWTITQRGEMWTARRPCRARGEHPRPQRPPSSGHLQASGVGLRSPGRRPRPAGRGRPSNG